MENFDLKKYLAEGKLLTEIDADLEDAIKTLLSQASEQADEYNIPEERFKQYLIDLINDIVY